ncbi:hypothetical protein AOL_s00081g7 [Orbilia oligospora ATCC 24927]|uniref:Extracellular membrane protein CFEM domain-containing protein n=2 Tax=Orbilia oligospora TaxID=2813651 RepID=G1XF66_ARTOA|nr:hypothetical protein AOL_s00081g7 [Orbilia oligospora ATCC 24927]EGX48144.1 hypothetical protein AOL_s00081g7 [Orbilia oligospora ATCC 24927]KAF3290740.1 hypothetical protein TWF970_000006 [Orbilia oligospora]
MSTPALPLLTKWPCADTCITAYDGFCERFTFTNIWPATAQCLLSTCNEKDRIALQKSVAGYCDAVGYPDVWGPYMWGATDEDAPSKTTSVKSASVESTSSSTPTVSTSPISSAAPVPVPPATVTIINNAAATTFAEPTTTTTNLPSESQGPSSGLPTAAKAGIAAGIVFLAVLILLGWFLFRWRKRKNEPNFPEGPDHSPTPSPKVKDFEEAPVISYSIEGGMLTRKEKPNLSIRVIT